MKHLYVRARASHSFLFHSRTDTHTCIFCKVILKHWPCCVSKYCFLQTHDCRLKLDVAGSHLSIVRIANYVVYQQPVFSAMKHTESNPDCYLLTTMISKLFRHKLSAYHRSNQNTSFLFQVMVVLCSWVQVSEHP